MQILIRIFLFVIFLIFVAKSDPSPLCYENGPCKCFDNNSRMTCHGHPLEEWWNPVVYTAHPNVVSLAIIATTLFSPITSLKNFPNLRQLEIQQAFKDNRCRPVLAEDVFADTPVTGSLTGVKFVNVEILCVIPNALRQLASLKNLEFRFTGLRLRDENDFHGFESLERLTIVRTSNVPSDYGSPYPAFPPRAFSRLPNLEYLSLENYANLRPHYNLFAGLENRLRVLQLKKCSLVDADLSQLETLTNLETLDVSDNLLMLTWPLNPNLFATHPNLKSLSLNKNRGIRTLDMFWFEGATNLLELHIVGAEIDTVDLTFLKNTPKLKFLDISENYATLFKIVYPTGDSKILPKAKLHVCKSSIGFIDYALKELLVHGGQMNISENTNINCDPYQNGWLAEMVHCHKKHGLIYGRDTRCTSNEEDSFNLFLQSVTPAVCKATDCTPTLFSVVVLFVVTFIIFK